MSAISAYMLFKIREGGEDNPMNNGLQVLFFFMVLANFIIMGGVGYESRLDCNYLLVNETAVNASLITNSYEYICTERAGGSASWIYQLPVWLAGASALYLVLWLLLLVVSLLKQTFGSGGERE